VAGFAFLAITLGNSAAVRADLVASFTNNQNNDYIYAGGGTTSTLTTSPTPLSAVLTFGPTFANFALTPYNVNITETTTFSSTTQATGTGSGSSFSGTQTGWSGAYTITNNTGGTVQGVLQGGIFLTVQFSGATLTVVNSSSSGTALLGGGSVIITPGAFTAGAVNPIIQPETFGFTLPGISSSVSVAGGSSVGFTSFTASDSGNTTATVVPEPSTMAIAGLGALGMIGYGLRRRKALGA